MTPTFKRPLLVCIKWLLFVCLIFRIKVLGEFDPPLHMNQTKFDRSSFLGYYHMTYIGKQNMQAKEV